ncbi:MAG: DUF86 domain-containing protein [Bacteroidetes bacterium]|nr:DUF86 domain-containing protein [Bacteroidota bacterium]MCB0852250.1 DUF86 domain-containing protein [Bacteroidota bacterium]
MTRNAKKYLYDIDKCIDNIFKIHLDGISNIKDFKQDITAIRAIEREIEIIGEALYRLRQMQVELSLTDSIINKRNTIAHQYDATKEENLWSFVFHDLPSLNQEVAQLLNQ